MTKENFVKQYLLTDLTAPLDGWRSVALEKAEKQLKKAGMKIKPENLMLYRRSVDARKKSEVHFLCSVAFASDAPLSEKTLEKIGARELSCEPLLLPEERRKYNLPPIIVGTGPAGLFCGYVLAQAGYQPILLERGDDVTARGEKVKAFRNLGILDTESNVQFGAGGAGTFSDGKLLTRVSDPKIRYVLETFVKFGAPEEILWQAKPHVGTDVLCVVVEKMLAEIVRLGGKVIYRCRVKDFEETAEGVRVQTSRGEMTGSRLVLATGHSARDIYELLSEKQFMLAPKPLSVGVRAEHLKKDIDTALYGNFAGHPELGPGEYTLSDTKGRGVYSFCMCPGGEVMTASSEEGRLCVNGMSNSLRDGRNSNSAVVVTVQPEDIQPEKGSLCLGMMAFQRQIESRAYLLGGSDYCAPVMTVGDFMNGTHGTEPKRVLPTYGGGRVKVADLTKLFPDYVNETLKRGFSSFDRKINGFASADAILTGAETRTSAPMRIVRENDTLLAVGKKNVYPCGEGAGYAGGITSAALDGIRVALAIMKN